MRLFCAMLLVAALGCGAAETPKPVLKVKSNTAKNNLAMLTAKLQQAQNSLDAVLLEIEKQEKEARNPRPQRVDTREELQKNRLQLEAELADLQQQIETAKEEVDQAAAAEKAAR